ncbi:MAG TPA: hypothetical protein VHD62_06935 [Opitutaceae bacterium]|nr:hypothetical protein [Opitutaceae bacterium]
MKRSDQDRLLREILADEALERVRTATLAAGVAMLRRRRRRRVIAATAVASAAFALLFATVMQRRLAPPAAQSTAVPTAATPRVKWIDDDRLLALFSERGVALIGRPGEQRLVLLDSAPSKR